MSRGNAWYRTQLGGEAEARRLLSGGGPLASASAGAFAEHLGGGLVRFNQAAYDALRGLPWRADFRIDDVSGDVPVMEFEPERLEVIAEPRGRRGDGGFPPG